MGIDFTANKNIILLVQRLFCIQWLNLWPSGLLSHIPVAEVQLLPAVTHLTPFLVTILVEEALKTFSKRCSLNQSILQGGTRRRSSEERNLLLEAVTSVCHMLLHKRAVPARIPAARGQSKCPWAATLLNHRQPKKKCRMGFNASWACFHRFLPGREKQRFPKEGGRSGKTAAQHNPLHQKRHKYTVQSLPCVTVSLTRLRV